MAKRLQPRHQDEIRKKIQASQLINRLQAEALGQIELTDGQRESAKFLLTRCISPPVPKDDDGKTQQGPVIITWQGS